MTGRTVMKNTKKVHYEVHSRNGSLTYRQFPELRLAQKAAALANGYPGVHILKVTTTIEYQLVEPVTDVLAHVALIHSKAVENRGGTFDVKSGVDVCATPMFNYAVSIFPEVTECIRASDGLTVAQVFAFIRGNRKLLALPGHYMGIWFDDKEWYLDISVGTANRKFARYCTERCNQTAFWDVRRKKAVYSQAFNSLALPVEIVGRFDRLKSDFTHKQ